MIQLRCDRCSTLSHETRGVEPASTEWVIVRRGFVHMEGVREQHYCTLACAVSVLANDLVREAKK